MALRSAPPRRAEHAVANAEHGARSGVRRERRAAAKVACAASRRDVLATTGLLALPGAAAAPGSALADAGGSIYDYTVQQYGEDVAMSRYRNDVLVVVNVASE